MYKRHSFVENDAIYMSAWLSRYIWQAVEHDLRKLHRTSVRLGKNANPELIRVLKYCADELMTMHTYTCKAEENHDIICKKIRGEVPGL